MTQKIKILCNLFTGLNILLKSILQLLEGSLKLFFFGVQRSNLI